MSDLIDRSALGIGYANPLVFDNPGYAKGWNSAVEIIKNAPAVDAVEVVYGRWKRILLGNYECSHCGCIPYYAGSIYTLHYCPNCGAKMDGGKDDA